MVSKPVEWPDKVTVYHKLSEVGDSSFTLGVISVPLRLI